MARPLWGSVRARGASLRVQTEAKFFASPTAIIGANSGSRTRTNDLRIMIPLL